MPICCEPGARYPIVLEGDKDKRPTPTFWCRHLSARQFTAHLAVARTIVAEEDPERRLHLLCGSLAESIVDWTEIRDAAGELLTYQPDRVGDVLTIREAWELWDLIVAGNRLQADDAKKSDSPSPSGSGNTAAAAGPEAAATAPASPAR